MNKPEINPPGLNTEPKKDTLNTQPLLDNKETTKNTPKNTLNTDLISKDTKPLAESVPALAEGPTELEIKCEAFEVEYKKGILGLKAITEKVGISYGTGCSMAKKIKKEALRLNKSDDGNSNLTNQRLEQANIKQVDPLKVLKLALKADKLVLDKNGGEHEHPDWNARLNAVEKLLNLQDQYPAKTSKVHHTYTKEVKQLQDIFAKRRKQLKLAS